jgi:hypothetical protein
VKYQTPPSQALKLACSQRDHANGTVGLPKTVLMRIPQWAGTISVLTGRANGGYASKCEMGGVKTVRNVKEPDVMLCRKSCQ